MMKRITSIKTYAARAAVTLFLALLTTMTAWADEAVTLSVDNDIAEGTAGHYYVNMLSSGTSILTLNDASVTTFKVYDDGGKNSHYAYTGNSFLKITVPVGYVIGISGTAKSEDTTWDYWEIYNGHVYSDGRLFDGKDKSNPASVNVQTTGYKAAIYFRKGKSSYSNESRNLELTVTLIPDPTYAQDISRATVSGMESVYNYTGSVISVNYSVYSYIQNNLLTKGTHYTETITKDGVVTEFKEEGYYTLTITGKDSYYGSQSFNLRIKNDSPELRQDGSEWFVNMPYSGTHTPTLDGNIPTFKIYDDGGKGGGYSKGTAGNFSPGADGYLQIHAPTGYQVHLTGHVRTTSDRAYLTVYDGSSTSASTLCENIHGVNSAANAADYKNVTVDVTSSGEDMLLHFDALQETWDAEGLILTASIGHSITVADGITHGSVSCENFWIKGSSTTIPLTVTPDVGYSVNTVSYNDDSDHTLTADGSRNYSFTMPNTKVTVNATFAPIEYTVSFNANGGEGDAMAAQNYTYDTAQNLTANTYTRTGYTFAGWATSADGDVVYTDQAEVSNLTTTQGANVELFAKWTAIEYTITYNGVEEATFATANPATYTIESDAITLNNPTKDGYTFAGWTGTGLDAATETVTIAHGSMGARTYTATWTPIVYTITYNGVEGATFATANPTTYTIESDAITLNNPTREGYDFGGWYNNSGLTGDAVTTIAAGSTGDVVLWAKWTAATTLALGANQAPDENYWTTFYCGDAGYTIDDGENACAYTAEYDGTNHQLTLHKLGKTIAKGEAVIIVADNNEVSMTKAGDGTCSDDNDLHGVDVETATADIQTTLGEGTFYVLGMTNGNFGFHKYTGATMAARKAFVLINGSNAALARSLTMVFDDATGIISIDNGKLTIDNEAGAWYTLDGRRLQGKPSANGVYINNGKKIVIK